VMIALLGSTPRPVLPAVAWAAFKVVAHEPVSRIDVAALLLPHALRADGARADNVEIALDMLVDLGLLIEDDGDLQVAPQLDAGVPADERAFRRALRRRILDPSLNDELLASDDGMREFTKALAWFLAQPVDDPPTSYNPRARAETNSVTGLLNEQFGSDEGAKSILQNSSRWPPFVRWAKYLGLAAYIPSKESGPCPNPTEAIRDELPEIRRVLPEEVELPRLVDEIAKAIPVLDGGTYRDLVDGLMDARPASAGDAETFSGSFSLALLRLKDERLLELRRVSDSPATRALSLRKGHRLLYSHGQVLSPLKVAP